jgi:hypothetical protein
MKLRIGRKVLLLVVMVFTLFTVLSGCSSQEKETSFQMAFTSLFICQDAIDEYGESLARDMPELTIDGNAPVFTPIISGAVENNPEEGILNDPMLGMAGMMQMTALTAIGGLDVVVSDMENAARNARGDMFIPLDELFNADELANMTDRYISFDYVESADSYEFVPTGEKTPVCGINITGNEEMKKIFGNQEIGVFIVANTKNMDLAKAVMLSLIE